MFERLLRVKMLIFENLDEDEFLIWLRGVKYG